jgi:hypothetical protein
MFRTAASIWSRSELAMVTVRVICRHASMAAWRVCPPRANHVNTALTDAGVGHLVAASSRSEATFGSVSRAKAAETASAALGGAI